MKRIRKNQTQEELIEKSGEIEKKLFSLNELKEADTVLFYISYNNEVFTHDMIKKFLVDKKNVVVPISNKIDNSLILSKLEKWKDLHVGSYSILEPIKDKIKKISINEVDLIIIPGLGFDKKGNRLGHGKGYYDNLLKKSLNQTKIGLAFEFQIIDKIPVDDHDKPVDIIITEKRIINCNDK